MVLLKYEASPLAPIHSHELYTYGEYIISAMRAFPGDSYLLHVDLEGSIGLALGTSSWFHLLVLSLVERTQNEAAAKTVVLDHVQLGEDPRAAGHDTTGTDQLVQVELPERERERGVQRVYCYMRTISLD